MQRRLFFTTTVSLFFFFFFSRLRQPTGRHTPQSSQPVSHNRGLKTWLRTAYILLQTLYMPRCKSTVSELSAYLQTKRLNLQHNASLSLYIYSFTTTPPPPPPSFFWFASDMTDPGCHALQPHELPAHPGSAEGDRGGGGGPGDGDADLFRLRQRARANVRPRHRRKGERRCRKRAVEFVQGVRPFLRARYHRLTTELIVRALSKS